jgi:lipopolysaccharide export system permease protein
VDIGKGECMLKIKRLFGYDYLTLYLGKVLLSMIALTLLLILGVEWIFDLVNELKQVGTGDYYLPQAILFLLLNSPAKLYDFFPLCALIGSIMGLGILAGHGELTAMRAAGHSIGSIAIKIMKSAFVLTILVTLLGEYYIPTVQNTAQKQKAYALSQGQALQTKKGTWLRDGKDFVHIAKIEENKLTGVTRYQFDEKMKLISTSFAKEADFAKNYWVLKNIEETKITDEQITSQKIASQDWYSHIQPSVIQIVGNKGSERLSFNELSQTIQYRGSSGLAVSQFKLMWWQKLTQPLATMLMVFLAIPFVFGPLRSSTLGLKMIAGISIGFVYFSFNKALGPIAIVYDWPAWLAVFTPLVIFSLLGAWVMKKAW